LGLCLIFSTSPALDIAEQGRTGARSAVRFEFFSPTNPKAVVLFISVFATAVTSATPAWLMTLMIGLIFASALIW